MVAPGVTVRWANVTSSRVPGREVVSRRIRPRRRPGPDFLHRHHHGRLVAARAGLTWADTADEGLVDLDDAGEEIPLRSGRTMARRSLCIQAHAVS